MGVASGCKDAPLRLAITIPFSIGFGPDCSAISVPFSPITTIFAPRAGVAAKDALIVAIPPFLNSSVNKNASSVSALTILFVAVSIKSGRSVATRPCRAWLAQLSGAHLFGGSG